MADSYRERHRWGLQPRPSTVRRTAFPILLFVHIRAPSRSRTRRCTSETDPRDSTTYFSGSLIEVYPSSRVTEVKAVFK
jgi:hypothetical protein